METAVQTDQKLAAIMFTDIISYTKMMNKNEIKTNIESIVNKIEEINKKYIHSNKQINKQIF